jgi:hypothetical protein
VRKLFIRSGGNQKDGYLFFLNSKIVLRLLQRQDVRVRRTVYFSNLRLREPDPFPFAAHCGIEQPNFAASAFTSVWPIFSLLPLSMKFSSSRMIRYLPSAPRCQAR